MNLGRNVNTHPHFSIHKCSRGSTPQGCFFFKECLSPAPTPRFIPEKQSLTILLKVSTSKRTSPTNTSLPRLLLSQVWFIGYFFGKGNRKLGGSGTPPFPPRHLGRRCWPRPALDGAGSLLSGSESP